MQGSEVRVFAAAKPFVQGSFLIAGVARNCQRKLEKEIARLGAAFAGGKALRWIIVESDSSDDTLSELNRLSTQDENFRYVSLGSLRETLPKRSERLAYCRNAYVDLIRNDPAYADIDYVVVADLDGVNSRLTREAVLSCWENDSWDVCTANQDGPYYDIWALRHEHWSPNDCYDQLKFYCKYSKDFANNEGRAVHSRMITIPRGSEWIPVESAFGGLAIYPKTAFLDGSYHGLTDSGEEVCEHVSFHRSLRAKGYTIQINPSLINAGYIDHTRNLAFLRRNVKRCRDFGKALLRAAVRPGASEFMTPNGNKTR